MDKQNIMLWNRIFLGLVVLVPGLLKIFVMGPGAIVDMLSGIALFAWAPAFWAWVLILAEIVSGIAILSNWKMNYVVWAPIIILFVSALTVHWADWGRIVMHAALITNYLMWCDCGKHGKR